MKSPLIQVPGHLAPALHRIESSIGSVRRSGFIHHALRRIAVAGLLTALLSPVQTGAQQRHSPTVAAMLPAYCKQEVTGIRFTEAEVQRWNAAMGGYAMAHIHHYCRGLAHTAHALFTAKTPQERTWALGYSITEFDYMLNNAGLGKEFKLLPEVLTKKGENLIRLRRFPEATIALQRAIEVKPDYWPPYAVLSDYFKDMGDLPKAREWLDKALAVAPESKALRSRRAELGGGKATRATEAAPPPAKQRAPEKPAAPPTAADAEPAAEPAAK